MAMDRRRFFKHLTGTLIGLWGLAIVYPVSRYLKKPAEAGQDVSEVVVCAVSDIAAGQSKMFKFGAHPGMLICDSKGNYHAVDATCTHLGCTTQYRAAKEDVFCACHNGVYTLDGKNVSGPPPKPLASLKVAVKDDKIVVSKA